MQGHHRWNAEICRDRNKSIRQDLDESSIEVASHFQGLTENAHPQYDCQNTLLRKGGERGKFWDLWVERGRDSCSVDHENILL